MGPIISGTVALALVKGAVDFIRNSFDVRNKIPKPYWQLAAVAFGLVLSFAWKVDLLTSIGLHGSDTVGRILNGLSLGFGGGFLHDISDGGAPAPTPKGLLGGFRVSFGANKQPPAPPAA